MIYLTCRPIDEWIGKRTPWQDVRVASFRYKRETLTGDLTRELEHLDATDVTIGIAVGYDGIRVDGWPKGGRAVPPEVVLSFESRVGPLRFQCDRWSRWEDNLRAISLTITRLRLVEEAGVVTSGEQYRGWQALPQGDPIALGSGLTYDQARATVWDASGMDTCPDTADLLDQGWRYAAKHHHPDVGGDHDRWVRIEAAFRMLRNG